MIVCPIQQQSDNNVCVFNTDNIVNDNIKINK